jgi:hypothetical protein
MGVLVSILATAAVVGAIWAIYSGLAKVDDALEGLREWAITEHFN